MISLYADGGIVGGNIPAVGGTFAWCLVQDEQHIRRGSGFVPSRQGIRGRVENNLMELIALVLGLEALPDDWEGRVYSDSQVSIGRLFLGWNMAGIPPWLLARLDYQWERLDWNRIEGVLLDGHPTRYHLETGKGKRGNPVSIHNRWCDRECTRVAQYVTKNRWANGWYSVRVGPFENLDLEVYHNEPTTHIFTSTPHIATQVSGRAG